MAVYFPAHQQTQLVGLPPLKDETYARLGEAMKAIYAEYEAARQEASHAANKAAYDFKGTLPDGL